MPGWLDSQSSFALCLDSPPLLVLMTARAEGQAWNHKRLVSQNAGSASIVVPPLLSCLIQWKLMPNSRQGFDQHRLGEALVPVDPNCWWQAAAVGVESFCNQLALWQGRPLC